MATTPTTAELISGLTYFNWINNLHDWNISRQIWYGHRIPAWYHDTCQLPTEPKKNEPWTGQMEPIVSLEVPTKCPRCGSDILNNGDCTQDPDTLDTWFSAGLWTFSALGWPEQTKDLEMYHPTDVLETGYDILFFWVARMILMSEFLL
mgnify:FL=1